MDFTGERYIPGDETRGEIEIEHLQRYQSITDIVKDKIVLDAASGSGYGTQIIAKHAAYVYGIELSSEAVLSASKNFAAPNAKYICANISSLPLDSSSVDVVISFETIEHVDEDIQKKFLAEIKRVLKPDGVLVMSSPEKSVYSDLFNYNNEFHVNEFYEAEYSQFLKQYFKNIVFADQFIALAYVLKMKDSDKLKLFDKNTEIKNKAKYLVAVCSDEDIGVGEIFSANIAIDKEDLHYKKIQRVLDLQNENAEKNRVIDHAYSIVASKGREINKLAAEMSKLKEESGDQRKQSEDLLTTIEKQAVKLESAQKNVDEINMKYKQQKERADDLSKKLENIYSTKAWKIVQKIYWLKSKLGMS